LWTGLLGPAAALLNLFWGDPGLSLVYVAWICITRRCCLAAAVRARGEIRPAFPLFLYLNQLANSLIRATSRSGRRRSAGSNRADQRAAGLPRALVRIPRADGRLRHGDAG
jgi:hypothetical protein